MATPDLSWSTGALSGGPTADSDDEADDDDQSSMWVQEEDQASAGPSPDAEDQTSSDLPPDFLEPLSPDADLGPPLPPFPNGSSRTHQHERGPEIRQFWKSGDFVGSFEGASFATEGIDHARVHPKFLHSNATSHKWVLGAIAELLDNSVDEIRNGATFVKIDVQPNPRSGDPMLVIEDDGGGMDPDCMRRCMSLGYSAKTKISGTIGQYGNGFKTSTMRLGADVLVFSRNQKNKASESIGMMSYTFLTSTGQNDVVVPIVDFQIEAFGIRKLIRSNVDDWMESMQTIQEWSPYSSQAELVSQFRSMPRRQGTKVIIYNLWEDEEGRLELDFDAHPHDIQIRATTRDEKILKLAAQFPSCKHYLTYKHSLQTYISILYLRLPARFKILLRGREVPHYSLQKEMMLVEQVTYRPKDLGNSKAVVTLGFVKDAEEHIDVSGFNVYHKNRLIKPFWRIWNPSDSRGRGIIAILEANFVEPAHDKQGFERTIVLTRLEARLIEMQKSYWNKHSHRIGYTNRTLGKPGRAHSKDSNVPAKGSAPKSRFSEAAGAATFAETLQLTARQESQDANDHYIASKFSDASGALSHAIVQTMQEGCVTPSIIQVEEPSISMASSLNDAAKKEEIPFSGQAPVQDEPNLTFTSHGVQHPPTDSLPRVVAGTTNKLANLANLNSQESCLSCTAPMIIDLDPPDVDMNCQDTDNVMPSPQDIDHQTEITAEEMQLKSTDDASDADQNSAWSGAAAGLPRNKETQKLFDASICFSPAVEMALPETVESKSCSKHDPKEKHYGEARAEEHGIGESNDLDTAATEGCVAAAMAPVKECRVMELEAPERCIAAPTKSVEGCKQWELETPEKTVLENGPWSLFHVPPIIELDDFLDSLEGPSCNSPSIKETESFVPSPLSETEIVLPDQEENGALEAQMSSSTNVHGENEVAREVRNEDTITVQENNNTKMGQLDCEVSLKESFLTSLLPEIAINGLPDMDEAMVDGNGEEHHELVGIEQDTGVHERGQHQQVDKSMAFVPEDDGGIHDQNISCMTFVKLQEHENTVTTNIDVQKDSVDLALEQNTFENTALVLQNKINGQDGYNSQSSVQASCLDIVSTPTVAITDVVIDSSVDNLGRELLKEERFMAAKQQIDYLQQSIEAIVIEIDDLKEQLQQEFELQRIDMTNLNMEFEQALLRLKELSG